MTIIFGTLTFIAEKFADYVIHEIISCVIKGKEAIV